MPLFLPRTLEQHTNSLAQYLPGGRVFAAKNINGTTFRKYLRALAAELLRISNYMEDTVDEQFIDITELLINEWESAVGIPDSCFSASGDIATRRRNVKIKLDSLHGNTREDMIALAALLGYSVEFENASISGAFPLSFPIRFYGTGKEARATVIVKLPADEDPLVFPLDFPIEFRITENQILECLFNQMKPAHEVYLYEYTT